MTKAQQDAIKEQKTKAKHDNLREQYIALGENLVEAENFASLFPDSNPLDIIRGKSYNNQNKPIEEKIEKQLNS